MAGANPTVENRSERATPLHFAARRGDARMMKRLLSAGASVNARTNDGFSPLVEAVRCAPLQHDNGNDEIDREASKAAYEQHVQAANLVAAQSVFTRAESDKLRKMCSERDATIAALRKDLEDARVDAEKNRLLCLRRENSVRTASRAILCVFQSIFTQKGLVKGSHASSAIKDYQEMCRNMGLDVEGRKEENSLDTKDEKGGAAVKDVDAGEIKSAPEEGDLDTFADKEEAESWERTMFEHGIMPEFTERALAVDSWLPVTNPKKKPKKKSKAKLRKEREDKVMEAVSVVADRLSKMFDAGTLE